MLFRSGRLFFGDEKKDSKLTFPRRSRHAFFAVKVAEFRTLVKASGLAFVIYASSALEACQSSDGEKVTASGGAALTSGGRADPHGRGGASERGGSAGDSGSLGGAGGSNAGGVAGVSGAGGEDSGEAGAIGVGGGACLPEPLAALVAACPLAEDCSYATTDEGFLDVCYANGDDTRLIPRLHGGMTTVKTASGALCYVLDSTVRLDVTPNRQDYVWLDSEGSNVATGRIQESALDELIVKVEGVRYQVDLGSDACHGVSALPRGTERCELGACSF